MPSIHRLDITVNEIAQTVLDQLRLAGTSADGPRDTERLGEWLVGRAAGTQGTGITIAANMGAVKATGTVTISGMVATQTVIINGTTFTCVASGATANQFNVGGTDTITATNLAAAINASVTTTIKNVVVATSLAAVVTLTASVAGNTGNANTLTCAAGGSVSGARMTGGLDGTLMTFQRG